MANKKKKKKEKKGVSNRVAKAAKRASSRSTKKAAATRATRASSAASKKRAGQAAKVRSAAKASGAAAKEKKAKPAQKPAASAKAKAAGHALGRSFLAGEVGLDEIRRLTKGFADAAPLFSDDMMDGSTYDVVVADGDLHVKGDLRTFAHNLTGLIVRGSLSVDGLFQDTDDPACGVFVLGDMKAGRMITTGALGVAGSLTVADALVGFYNDYGARIGKDLVATLFHPENHHFHIGGRLEAKYVVGHGAEYRVPKSLKERAASLVPENLRAVLVDEVVMGDDADDQELDDSGLRTRVREGKPVLR